MSSEVWPNTFVHIGYLVAASVMRAWQASGIKTGSITSTVTYYKDEDLMQQQNKLFENGYSTLEIHI